MQTIFRPFILSLLLVFSAALGVFANDAEADPAIAAPLSEKPVTSAKMNLVTPWYMMSKQGDVSQRFADVAGMMASVSDGQSANQDPYDRGANPGDFSENFFFDYMMMLEHFFECAEPKIIGICWKMTMFGPVFDPFWEYFLPKLKNEAVDQPLKSGSILEPLNLAMLSILDNPSNPVSHYYQAPEMLPSEIKFSRNVAAHYLERYFDTPLPPASGDFDKELMKKAVQDVKDNFSQEVRFRSHSSSGVKFSEYHIMPTWFEEMLDMFPVIGQIFPRYHIRKNVGFYNSDWPGAKLPATFGMFSYFMFPTEMFELFGAPGSGAMGFPLTCTGYNMRKGLQLNPLGVFTTPFDLLNTTGGIGGVSGRLMVSPGQGCLGINQGNWTPVTAVMNQGYAAPAAAVGTVKGIKTAYQITPAFFYDFTFKNDAKYPDKVQWLQSKAVREATGGQCIKPEQPLSIYKDGLARQHPINDHADWHVQAVWRYFRVCKPGFSPLVAWNGDLTTQYQ